ncbi:tetratricopeptide repeat protein [Persephonella atlantica]|uniref:Tetratricopeptide repeat protein n=1 Tax=Persephonella atlantica TaxID=2699429 RepID=A0ABS1GFI1_9AQUI|nr:SPOR domain-containing protein [Persephonella atlantica]MBK3331581.1 tetratricopeptide repeat protein [Persephonella atlantica]
MKFVQILFTAALIILYSCAPKPYKTEEKTVQNATYYYKIGLSYLNSGNNSQALYYLSRASEIDPNNPEILNALGIAYSNVGEVEKAKEMFLKAIEKDPDRAETYTNLGTLLAKEKQYEKALWYFKKAAENPNYLKKDVAIYNIALIYRQMGNLKLYEENLKKALSYNSFLLPAYISLGELFLEEKRYDDALTVYLMAKEKGLINPQIYLGLGDVYIQLGDYEKAKEYLLKAKKLARDDDLLLIKINRLLNLTDRKIIEKTEQKIEKIPEEKETAVQPNKVVPQEKKEEEKNQSERLEIAKKTNEEKKSVIKPKIRFYVLVGRFSDENKAMEIIEKLRSKGFTPELKEETIDENTVYSVIIGYFKEYREASRFYRKKLKPLGLRGIVKFIRM